MTPLRVIDIVPGDEILGWMRIGFALKRGRAVNGSVYMYVPTKAQRAAPTDMNRYTGWVVANNVAAKVLVVEVQQMNRYTMAVSTPVRAEIPYMTMYRLRRLSKVVFPGKPENPERPTHRAIGSQNRPYRTIEDVLLTWT